MEQQIFVSGATGFQGRPTAQLLQKKGYTVNTLSPSTKSPKKQEDLRVYPGSLDSHDALGKALNGVEKAVFGLPLIFDLEQAISYTQNFIATAELAGVRLVVFNTGFDLPQNETGLLALDLKIAIAKLFKASSLKVITLMPDIYIDNLVAPWSLPLIVQQNIMPYPVPADALVPWISHNDLARFTVAALERPELAGQTLPIGGQLHSGEEIAQAISAHLGKSVDFIPVAPDDFEAQLKDGFGTLAAQEIANLYRYVAANLNHLQSKPFTTTQTVLGVTPQSLNEWVNTVKWP
ncbi:SDR family oxidoreductase [Sediminicola luteus]|uniref:NmrA family transcriptional regulator n=1 Tax=Sediminicola luteus TaxID=319238 RepID=A0A2A4G384_9FLAO|nr:NmrA family NAD(P)-binding protein [Sediminicola luteus]PCE62891.1 NmrA family transcriptional regulator [Sediminicola luteus]